MFDSFEIKFRSMRIFIQNSLLPSATKLRRLCFYTCLSVILFTGGVPGQVPPGQVHRPGRYTPGPGTPLGTRYTPPPPGTRYTPLPPGPGTPPGRYTPSPRTRYPLPGPGTPPPGDRDGYCCGRYASCWNAFLLF